MGTPTQLIGVQITDATNKCAVERLKKIKKEQKFTQKQLADSMGYNQPSAISQILRQKFPLNLIQVVNFSKVLGVNPLDIYPELVAPVVAALSIPRSSNY
jgi:transcriptional regulator with XRE-family HTH domain